MTRSCIDCNLEAKLASRKRRKLGQNRGELVSHRSVAVYPLRAASNDEYIIYILVTYIAHS